MISDNFNRANSATLGSSAQGWSWTEVAGSTSIVSNQASCDTQGGSVGNHNRAESDLASADHYAQIDVTISPGANDGGVAVRYDPSADTFYLVDIDTVNMTIYKVIGGSGYTSLGSASITYIAGTTVKAQIVGDAITGYYGGALILTVHDSSITGNLRTGFHGYNNTISPLMDNFQADSVGGGGSTMAAGQYYRLAGLGDAQGF